MAELPKNNSIYENMKELLELRDWILRMIEIRENSEFVMESSYLTEITTRKLYIKLTPINYCLYDHVDVFLEENGIEVSYVSNFILFKKKNIKNFEVGEIYSYINGVYGLLSIGWGEYIIAILRDGQLEILWEKRVSNYGVQSAINFDSQIDLDRYIYQIRKERYKYMCQLFNELIINDIDQLNSVYIGLRKYIRRDEIDLNWFYDPILKKINNIIEIENSGQSGLNEILSYLQKKD